MFRRFYKSSDSVALAREFLLGGSSILCVNPNALKKAELIKDITSPDSEDIYQNMRLLRKIRHPAFKEPCVLPDCMFDEVEEEEE